MKTSEVKKIKERCPDQWIDLVEFYTRNVDTSGKGWKSVLVTEEEAARMMDSYEAKTH